MNTTDSAVRMTHIPTGIVVSMQDEKSQIQNRAAALRVLQSRLLVLRHEEEQAEEEGTRGRRQGVVGRPDALLRPPAVSDGQGPAHRVRVRQSRSPSSTATSTASSTPASAGARTSRRPLRTEHRLRATRPRPRRIDAARPGRARPGRTPGGGLSATPACFPRVAAGT